MFTKIVPIIESKQYFPSNDNEVISKQTINVDRLIIKQENSIPESEIKLFWPQTCGDVHYVSNHEAGVVK